MQKRRTSFYIYIAVMAVLTIALAAFRTVTLAQSISENVSLKVFSEAFYTSDTVYKISIPVFILLSALVLIFVCKKKTVMLSRRARVEKQRRLSVVWVFFSAV